MNSLNKFDYRNAEILLIDDDEADIKLTKRTLEKSRLNLNLNIARDGVEALKYLNQEAPYENAPKPDLIFLDLNMPKMDGKETLKRIKESSNLRKIPVVILTTSKQEQDIARSYKLGCNAYVIKPVGIEAFTQVIQEVENFWLSIVTLSENKS